ncbi:hypothetical protein [Aeromonas media]|uniref:hypothetical protein n=1 Tax=Aeromonas media TaxID=651 RepID=UPI002282DBE5|nr:hypothetical protein [Aeromonas media]MCY9822473.1 hypothetical protein [Aeromonas media]
MALSKFTDTLIKGFQTSPAGAAAHHAVALRINNAIDVFDALNADKSRPKSEKAVMYKQLQDQHGGDIRKSLARFHDDLSARADNLAQAADKALTSVSMAEAVQIVVGLKQAGLSADAIRATIADSKEIAVAMARVPSALSGFEPEVATRAALKHFPELVADEDAIRRDLSAYQSLERVVAKTIMEIGMNVGEQALAARFDPSRLNPTTESAE